MTTVHASTPSRLHFGLLRLHETAGLSFGGLGMMIDQPRVELDIAAADRWSVTGPAVRRAARFAELALAAIDCPTKPPALRLHVESVIPPHRGLGSGTQLALALAAAVRELVGLPPGSAAELAAAVGRGVRSAVGSHGFVHGGLNWEHGRAAAVPLSPLAGHVSVPDAWRIVLVTPDEGRGLSGDSEREAFDRLPPVPPAVTKRLELLAEEQILPAARAPDIDVFGSAVYEYGRLAGECFAPIQGGPYASREIAACVSAIRDFGVPGVGQSSWGPSVFAIVASPQAAADLADRLARNARWAEVETKIVAPDNRGAVIERRGARIDPAASQAGEERR